MSDSAPHRPSTPRPTPARVKRVEPVERVDRTEDPGREEEGGPTPARALLEETEHEGAAPPPEAEEATLEAGGDSWRVRVVGRSRTGAATGASPLLLLFFYRGGGEEPERESLVVGQTLAELGREELLAAFERGRRPPEPGAHKEIFPEVGGRRRDRNG